MSELCTKYRGYEICYSEDADNWQCRALDLEGATLSKIKVKVAKIDADSRKIDNLKVFILGSWSSDVKSRLAMSWADKSHVWIVGNGRRAKENIQSIVLDTFENRAAIQMAAALTAKSVALTKEARGMLDALPRIVPPANVTLDTEE
jgi:hypothetical protein